MTRLPAWLFLDHTSKSDWWFELRFVLQLKLIIIISFHIIFILCFILVHMRTYRGLCFSLCTIFLLWDLVWCVSCVHMLFPYGCFTWHAVRRCYSILSAYNVPHPLRCLVSIQTSFAFQVEMNPLSFQEVWLTCLICFWGEFFFVFNITFSNEKLWS